MNPELGVVLLTAVAAIVVTWLLFSLLRRVQNPLSGSLGFGAILDLTVSYLSHYLLASVVLSPLLGMALGKPVLILLLPVVHFFAAIVILPGAFVITYVARRWLDRRWTRTRAWVAAVLTVVGMWLLSFVLAVAWGRPPDLLIRFLGEALAAVVHLVSIPMGASALSLILVWFMPPRVSIGASKP